MAGGSAGLSCPAVPAEQEQLELFVPKRDNRMEKRRFWEE
jgi:hypothetical protein